MKIDTRELDAIAADLGKAGYKVGAKTAAAFRKTARDIERDAKALCPVGATGDLRRSISVQVIGDGRFSAMAAEIGPTVDYGGYQEFGTSKMAPNPYLAPAFDRHIGPFNKVIGDIAAADLL